jgi:hypothetical protein
MSKAKFTPGDIVVHVLEPHHKIVILWRSPEHEDRYTCRCYNKLTGLFITQDFEGIELTLAEED